MRPLLGALVAVLLSASCGGTSAPKAESPGSPSAMQSVTATSATSGPASSTPSAAASPSPSGPAAAGLLFVVTEGPSQFGAPPDTVAIVGMDGYAKAKAKFQARQRPFIGNEAVPMQPVVQVVGSAAYYIDGFGTVRVLQLNSPPRVIATFAEQPVQIETWFAVSPDGSRVLAGILQYPAIGPRPTVCTALCLPPLIGPWKFSLEMADAGGTTTTLSQVESLNHPDSPNPGWQSIFPVGWTSAGPVAMVPVHLGTQNFWDGGPLYVIDGAGHEAAQVGGVDCHSASIRPSGLIPCITAQGLVELRDSTGAVIWTTQVQTNADSIYLSPDANAVSDGSSGAVELRTGASVQLPVGFLVEGWLDNSTVVGRVLQGNSAGNLSWINLGGPTTVHDLGVKGDFVATLPAPA